MRLESGLASEASNPGMTRVVHLISGRMYGGGQKVALDLLDGLAMTGQVDAQLWLLGCRYDSLRDRATFIADYDGDYSSLSTLFSAARRVRAQLAKSEIDIVHSHGWDADAVAFLATFGRRQEARIVHLHVTPAWIFSKSLHHAARRLLTAGVLSGQRTRVLAVARAVLKHWSLVFDLGRNGQVIYNSVDSQRFHPPSSTTSADGDPGGLRFGVACRLAPQKGLEVLMRAFAQTLGGIGGPCTLWIAGEGPEREKLVQLANDLGIVHAVTFLGHISEVDQFYRTLDVLILPAVSDEGMPLAILEAMASGLATITTDVGGSGEAIRDGIDGIIVPPKDAESLSAAMTGLLASPERRRTMGNSALQRARSEFSSRSQIEAVAAAYATLQQSMPGSSKSRPLANA